MSQPGHSVAIRRWSCIECLSSLGEAVLTFAVNYHPHAADIVLIVSVNPRSLGVTRVAVLSSEGEADQWHPDSLPFGVRDLAETIVRERFPLR